ncbi:hypothetical protein Tco_0414604 [Tanacetum coccineum]
MIKTKDSRTQRQSIYSIKETLTSDVNVGVRSVEEIHIEVLYDGWNKMFVQMYTGFAAPKFTAPELAAPELAVSQNSQFLRIHSSRTRSFSELAAPELLVSQNSQL